MSVCPLLAFFVRFLPTMPPSPFLSDMDIILFSRTFSILSFPVRSFSNSAYVAVWPPASIDVSIIRTASWGRGELERGVEQRLLTLPFLREQQHWHDEW